MPQICSESKDNSLLLAAPGPFGELPPPQRTVLRASHAHCHPAVRVVHKSYHDIRRESAGRLGLRSIGEICVICGFLVPRAERFQCCRSLTSYRPICVICQICGSLLKAQTTNGALTAGTVPSPSRLTNARPRYSRIPRPLAPSVATHPLRGTTTPRPGPPATARSACPARRQTARHRGSPAPP